MKGDILKSVNGETFVDADQLHGSSSKNGSSTADDGSTFMRKGVQQSAQLTPE